MELLAMAGDLMPEGKPTFLEVVKYPMIKKLVDDLGKKTMMKVLFLLVKDFCSSMNVVRNMNEDQMIESAAMLLDECDNFRMEDYVMMFQMAKRGQLVKVMDRIDINVITLMLDAYWEKRRDTALVQQEKEEKELNGYGSVNKIVDDLHPEDAKLTRATDGLAGAMGELKNQYKEWKEDEPKPTT